MESVKGYAQLSNVKMYYEMAGEGEALLLIHGIDSDSRLWDDQFEAFSRLYKTIRFDLRGFGHTPMPPGDFQLLDDLRDLLDELKVESAHILGYSYGGTVAPSFALKYPNKVKSLILTGAGLVGHTWSEEVAHYFKSFQEAFQARNTEEMMRLLKWKSVYGPYRVEDGLTSICNKLERMFAHALSIPREGRPLPTGDPRGQLEQITVPTLILTGELDFADYHQIADFYTKQIPDSSAIIIPGVAHLMNLENPPEFNRLVLDFLSTVTAESRTQGN